MCWENTLWSQKPQVIFLVLKTAGTKVYNYEMAWCSIHLLITLPLPKDWGLEKLRSIFYPLMAYYNIFGKVLSDLARVTELVHSSPKFFLVLSCLYPYLTVFFPLNYSVGSVSHYLPTHFKTWVFDSQTSSFEGMLEISEDSGKELADIWDFLG